MMYQPGPSRMILYGVTIQLSKEAENYDALKLAKYLNKKFKEISGYDLTIKQTKNGVEIENPIYQNPEVAKVTLSNK